MSVFEGHIPFVETAGPTDNAEANDKVRSVGRGIDWH